MLYVISPLPLDTIGPNSPNFNTTAIRVVYTRIDHSRLKLSAPRDLKASTLLHSHVVEVDMVLTIHWSINAHIELFFSVLQKPGD
jgi:hypothetical protein